MIWNFFIQIAVAFVLSVVSYALAPKPPKRSPSDPRRQFPDPTAEPEDLYRLCLGRLLFSLLMLYSTIIKRFSGRAMLPTIL